MNLSNSIKNLKNKIEDINNKVTNLIDSSNLANAKAKDNEIKVENVISTTDNNLKNINENMKKINIINDELYSVEDTFLKLTNTDYVGKTTNFIDVYPSKFMIFGGVKTVYTGDQFTGSAEDWDDSSQKALVKIKISNENETKDLVYKIPSTLKNIKNIAFDRLDLVNMKLYQKCDMLKLTGSESWERDTTVTHSKKNTITFKMSIDGKGALKPSNNDKEAVAVSNNNDFIVYSYNFLNENDMQCFCFTQGGLLKIQIKRSSLATQDVNGFKAWLSTANLAIFFEKESESVTNITGEKIKLCPNATIEMTNAVKPSKIEIKYQGSVVKAFADVNTSLSNKVNKSGDTMTGALTIKKSGDDATLLTFDTERSWSFKQGNTGADTSLDLVSSNNNKSFRILNTDRTKGLDVFTDAFATSVRIDGNKVYHAGDKPKLSELTNDAGFITGSNLNGYATKTFVTDEINKASLSGGTVDLSDYAKTADVNTSLSNKVDKTSILSAISSNPSDDKLLSEKAIYDALLNNSSIYDDSEIEKYFHNTSAYEFVNMLSPAVNLGNTLDCHLNTEHPTAPDTIIGWETLWNNVETTKKIMETYKKVGFKAIRIPITWHEHMDENGVIASEWLARVKTIVDWAIESGLIVIINAHHDTNEGNYINAVASDYETSKAHLINIWTQVGEYFANYDNRLVFESMNECLNPNLSDKWHGDAESFKVINKLNQVFVNTVRSQAWNRNRFLLVPTYAAGASTEVTSAFVMPRDNVKDRLIVEVHTYNTTLAKIKSAQASVRANLIERGFPVFLGEYGVRPSEVTDETERLNLLQLQTKMFREMGAGVCIWDNGNGSYKLLNRKTYAFYYPDIVNGIIKSSNKHDFVKLPYLDESYNIKDISNWKEGKIGHSDGEYDSTGTHYFTSDQHLIPRYSSYIVSMNDHSNDRLLVVHRDKNMKMIGGVETKTNGGTITISANDRYIDFCYYNKSTTSTLTKEQFAEYLNNGYLQINKADDATQNFEIIEQPLNEALIDLDKRIGNGVDLTGYATVDYVDRQIASVSTSGTTAVNAPEPEYFENLNATQVLEKISPGINLGNTLDSWDSYKHPDRTPIDWETSWHNVETTKEILKCYKDKGFKTLRIPITWFVHMDDSGVINSEWLTRVKQIVDWTLELGMNVIINVHHDTNEGDYISATPSKQDQSVANLINIWNQVGTYFSDYDYRVLFECMNECLDLTLGNSAKWDGTEEAYKVINVLNQAFVKTIRRQEGNKNRFLIVPTYACSAFEAQTNAFKLPYDPSNRLIVELHNYNKSIPEINKLIYPIFKNFTSKGIPVLMGEFGLTESNISDLTERTKMIKYYVQTIRELGCGVCYWDGGDYAILDRENKSWKYDNYAETILSIANHYRIYNTESFENADLNDINLWAVGKHSSSTGVVNYYATQNMACRFYFKPTHTEYTINTDDSSLDRFNVVQLADDFTFISNIKVDPGIAFTINSNCKYIGLSYYKKDASTGSPIDITIESFGANLSNKTIKIIPSGDLLGKNDISLTKEQANKALNRALGTYGIDYFS